MILSRVSSPFLILAIISCINPDIMAQSATKNDKEAITAVSKARAKAFNEGNAKEIARYFTEDAILMAPGKPASVGREAVKAYYQAIFDEYKPELDSHYEEVEVSGDLAYGRGEAIVRLTPRNGGIPTVATAKYLNILRRQSDGTWKTTHDIWNSNETAP